LAQVLEEARGHAVAPVAIGPLFQEFDLLISQRGGGFVVGGDPEMTDRRVVGQLDPTAEESHVANLVEHGAQPIIGRGSIDGPRGGLVERRIIPPPDVHSGKDMDHGRILAPVHEDALQSLVPPNDMPTLRSQGTPPGRAAAVGWSIGSGRLAAPADQIAGFVVAFRVSPPKEVIVANPLRPTVTSRF
jgi:hypothetical protein